ncbi:MAG: methionine gamma-lyase family protein [Bacilli bacterium]|nr:methionine gamma-lyase family protein [Bacilli bacterium]
MNNEFIKKIDEKIKDEIKKIDDLEEYYSFKVLEAFRKFKISETDFYGTTGYGYNDIGRDKIDEIFAYVLDSEKALVRSQFISGSHALTTTFFGLLRPNDTLLSITGKPYDTLDEVIGIKENKSSLKSFGIKYEQIDLVENDFNYQEIENYLKENPCKVIEIQRSKGYSTRKSLTLDKLEKVVKLIKSINPDVIIMVDNCYCEMTEYKTPISVGCDIMVGSLIKNLGGGIAPNGAYVAGRSDLVELVAERLTVPGQGSEVGPSLGINKQILQGLYFAPSVVASSLKTSIFASCCLEEFGYQTEPRYNEPRPDIVLNITFNDKEKLIKFAEGIQEMSAIDSFTRPVPTDMPGYSDQIIMASGSFTQGSSIEISCDGPLRPPYIAYLQGSLTYKYGRLAVLNAISKVINDEKN